MKPEISEKVRKIGSTSVNVIKKIFGIIFAFLSAVFILLVLLEGDDRAFRCFMGIAFAIAAVALLKPNKAAARKTKDSPSVITGVKVIERDSDAKTSAEHEPLKVSSEPAPANQEPFKYPSEPVQTAGTNHDKNRACAADDEHLFNIAVSIVVAEQRASVSGLMRRLELSYSDAWSLLERMERTGIIGAEVPGKPREVFITQDEWREILTSGNILAALEERQALLNSKPLRASAYEDNDGIIEDQHEWRREHMGLTQVEYELSRIDCMSGAEFEDWCAKLLTLCGFKDVKPTPASGDQGVDILAERSGVKYAVQGKCYSSDLGNKPVQEVYAGKMIYNCHVGVVATNRHFTPGGKSAAEATGVLLWDRDTLSEMMEPVLEQESCRKIMRGQIKMF